MKVARSSFFKALTFDVFTHFYSKFPPCTLHPRVADFTHDPSETLAVLETPRVDDDFSRAKKKPCLDDRDADSPLDKDRDTMPGPEE